MTEFRLSLLISGILIILINTFTAFFDNESLTFDEIVKSNFFLIRQMLSLISAFLLLLSALYIKSITIKVKTNIMTFILCVLGNVLLFTHEWTQIFFIRELSFFDSKTLLTIENQHSFNLFDISALLSISVFVLGWILFLLTTKELFKTSKVAIILIIGGFFLSPLLSAVFHPEYGALIGSLCIGFGFIKLYLDFRTLKPIN